MISDKEIRLVRTPLDLPILLFIIFNLSSLYNAFNFETGLRDLFTLLALILLFYLVVNNFKDFRQVERAFIPVFLAAGLVSLEGILENWGWGVLAWRMKAPEIFSFLGNPNYTAQYLITVFPLSVLLFLFATTRRKRIFFACFSALLAFFLFLLFSRGAALGLLVTFIFLTFILPRPRLNRSTKWLIAGLILAVTVSYFFAAEQPFQKLLRPIPARIINWKSTLLMIKNRPFLGYGIGNFSRVMPNYLLPRFHDIYPMQRIAEPHNDYLHIWAETGIFGLLTLLWLIGLYFRRTLRRFKSEPEYGYRRIFLAAFMAATLATLIQSSFSFNLHRPVSSLMFWTILGWSLVGGKSKDYFLSRRISSYAVLITLVALFGVLFYTCTIRPFTADVYYRQGKRYTDRQEWNKGLELFQKAVSIDSKNAQIHYALGCAYAQEGRFTKALGAYRAVMTLDPYHIYARNNLGMVFLALGKTKRAILEFRRATALDPYYGDSHVYLGKLALWRGDMNRAKGEYEQAEKAYVKHGLAFLSWGRPFRAEEEFNKALIVNPDSEAAKCGLRQVAAMKAILKTTRFWDKIR
jgi:putative inorganic carbon (HCO3(-)) transporter